jgi:hypothetical protein
MAFDKYLYEDDATNSFFIRLDRDQQTVAGAVKGVPTIPFSIRANPSSRRVLGLNPRHISCSRTVGTAPADKKFTTRLAICTPTAFAGLAEGAAVTINGVAYTITAKVPEQRR